MEEGKGKESHGLLGALQGVKGMIDLDTKNKESREYEGFEAHKPM